MERSQPPEGHTYPDIDETIHYPWQGNQPTPAGASKAKHAFDSRLYKGLFTKRARCPPAKSAGGDDDTDSDLPADPVEVDDFSEDPSYSLSEGESSSELESSQITDSDDGDDDDFSLRHRQRRRGLVSGRSGVRGGRGRGIKRGPRKPLEPSPEFKLLHSEATSAFIDGDYERAADLVKRAIHINPEMFAAHSLLSEILLAQGQTDKALTALFNAAHTRPRDPAVWAKVASLILERAGEDRQTALNDVVYCYSRVIEIEPQNYDARFQRAALYRELGYNGRAAADYERLLRDLPYDLRVLRYLAEIYIDLNEPQKAKLHYEESFSHYMSLDVEVPDLSWSDVNIYGELLSHSGDYEKGIKALKSLSRWLLGRKDDVMWEDFEDDDREWDADDYPRRIKTNGYIPGKWPKDSYGPGLPLELRIKFGLFRLKMDSQYRDEAMHHFEWLNPEDTSEQARLFDYGDLFREAADALKEVSLLEGALRYYKPLQKTREYADVGFFMAMGECCLNLGQLEDAENCYLTVAEHDARNIESRLRLAKLYESIGMTEQAFKYVNEAVLLGRQETRGRRRRRDARLEQLAREFQQAEMGAEIAPAQRIVPKPVSMEGILRRGPAAAAADRRRTEEHVAEWHRKEDIQFLYSKMLQLQPKVKQGDSEATEDWLDIADALLRDFRSNRAFYPFQKNMVFLGYSREAQRKAGRYKDQILMDEVHEMAGRLQESLGADSQDPFRTAIPTDYYGISFDEWLDMFLQYALIVAGQNEPEEAYDTLSAAADASVWYHSKKSTRLIHVCWFTCALRAQDEETLANEARWFIKEYQFVTDTYRLFAILSRLCGDPHRSLFHSSPNMKFMLRQIKAMDCTVPEDPSASKANKPARESIHRYRASLTTRDEMGEPIGAEELDVALLVLYGHILYSGNSFYPALNYFFRAYALDDKNPAVLLSIALCYIHQSVKRQAENRHYLIMQGLSFMHEYRRVREREDSLIQERQELEFNFARVWHFLGLTHLAAEGYRRVLVLGEQIQTPQQGQPVPTSAEARTTGEDATMEDAGADAPLGVQTRPPFVEDFSQEAAFALQNIYALSGDLASAKAVTEQWLVI